MIACPVQSLWIGGRLTEMERLAIQSFLANGHPFHLYCYDEPQGVPPGTVLRNAADVPPHGSVFSYAEGFAKGSYAAFSNFFRYNCSSIVAVGGWTLMWCACVGSTCPTSGSGVLERIDPPLELTVSSSVIKAPAGDALMSWAWEACQRLDKATIRFGQIGPRLLQAGVDTLGLHAFMKPHTFFSPIASFDWAKLLDPCADVTLGAEVFGVHLWNQMWSTNGVDKNATFPRECLYERLKLRFLNE